MFLVTGYIPEVCLGTMEVLWQMWPHLKQKEISYAIREI